MSTTAGRSASPGTWRPASQASPADRARTRPRWPTRDGLRARGGAADRDVVVEAAEAAGVYQVVDEGVGPVPRPREPPAELRLRGEDGGPDGGDEEVGEGLGRVGRGGGRAVVGLVPAGQFAVVPVPVPVTMVVVIGVPAARRHRDRAGHDGA